MKPQILLLAFLVAALSSCTSMYKTGQTPDDVYFSPTRPQDEYAQVEKRDNRRYEGRDEYYDDRYLRMRVSNRYRWSELDEWYYYGGRYDYSYYNYHNWHNPWTPYSYWNTCYNPYYPGYVIIKPKSNTFRGPRMTNLNTYNNNMLTNNSYSNPKAPKNGVRLFSNQGRSNSNSNSSYNNNSRSRNTGNVLRNIFNNNNNNSSNNNSNNSTQSRSSNTSSSSNSGSSGGGSAPVRRF